MLLLLAAIILLRFDVVFAESVNVAGVSLPVDALEQVDSQNSRITLFGKSKIVASSDLSREVVREYVSHADAFRRIGDDTWARLISTALQEGQIEVAQPVINGLLRSYNSESRLCRTLDEWLSGKSALQICKPLVNSADFSSFHEDCRVVLLTQCGRRDITWFRSNALAQAYPLQANLVLSTVSAWSKALREHDFKAAGNLAELLSVLGDDREGRIKRVKLATDLARLFALKGDGQTLADLLPLISLRNNHTDLAGALDPIILENIHQMADRALRGGKSEAALTLLSHIRSVDRTPTTHELLTRTMANLPLESSVISGKQVQDLVSAAAANDPRILGQIAGYFERRIERFLDDGRIGDAIGSLRELRMFRPDPSQLNDELRARIALVLLARHDQRAANDLLSGIQSGISLSTHAELFLAGYYGSITLYLLILLIPLLYRIGAGVIRAAAAPRVEVPADDEDDQAVEIDVGQMIRNVSASSASPAFKNVHLLTGRQRNPLYDEYVECLKVFGLDPASDVRSIRLAYRNAVKEIHPDLNVGKQTPETSALFMRLTKAYDRIREIQKQLNIRDSDED